jgi:hypothetical protein
MQRLVYTTEIDEELCDLKPLLEVLDEGLQLLAGCSVTRSRIESPDEVCENGEWEDEEDE